MDNIFTNKYDINDRIRVRHSKMVLLQYAVVDGNQITCECECKCRRRQRDSYAGRDNTKKEKLEIQAPSARAALQMFAL